VSPSAQFEVGFVLRARGLKGQVVIRTFDPASTVFDEVRRIVLRLKSGEVRELRIEDCEARSGDRILSIAGVADRTAADQLVGAAVSVFRSDLAPPAEGEYFEGDLVGLEAVDESGSLLGTVEDVWNTGPVPNLVIREAGGAEMLVPFADDFVLAVDLAARRVVLRPPQLLD
jgi:16S rRNA processing protein RimM